MSKPKTPKTGRISPEVEKKIAEIQKRVDSEYLYELYATQYESIVDMDVQDTWLRTSIGIDFTGEDEAKNLIEQNKKRRIKIRSQLDLIKANIK